ncbi:MAG: hypothetical protein KIT80_13180 [Chitinophagaceae bacterium]|nr:hypothetical protein [Chitinophagaceae bacterium]MCW5927860.1 hypothetical protein [Chitinophagaceae bacterium]
MKHSLLFIGVLLSSGCIFSQKNTQSDVFTMSPDTLFVSKEKCVCDYDGFFLRINESKHSSLEKECGDFSYELVYTASINQKINLIEALMQFENDTSLSCSKVKSYSSINKKYLDSIYSNRYSLQISALFHINLICFGEYAPFRYAPFPVLIDCNENKEINFDIQSIKEVFEIYKAWFDIAKKSKFRNYTFPLYDTKYKWKHGDYSKEIIFKELPEIKSDFKYRIGRPF